MPWNADGSYHEADHALDQQHLHKEDPAPRTPAGYDPDLEDLLATYCASARQANEDPAAVNGRVMDLGDLHRDIAAHIIRRSQT